MLYNKRCIIVNYYKFLVLYNLKYFNKKIELLLTVLV
jgi:hypothetical protein